MALKFRMSPVADIAMSHIGYEETLAVHPFYVRL